MLYFSGTLFKFSRSFPTLLQLTFLLYVYVNLLHFPVLFFLNIISKPFIKFVILF